MITQAILSNPQGVMSLSEIYNWIADHYAYYKYSKLVGKIRLDTICP